MEAYGSDLPAAHNEGKISRGWRLTQVAWKLIRTDRTMLTLAFAGIASASVFVFLIFLFGGFFSASHHSSGHLSLIVLIALYPSTLASAFFNVALACAASAAFDGDRLSTGEAIRMAWGKRKRIALWALISALVGTLIAEIANRLPGGAKLVAWFAGAAWGLATIFVIPILAMEGVGAVDALKRSSSLVKRRWGEGISGRISIGAWAIVATIPLAIVLGVGAGLLRRHPGAGVTLIGLSLIGLVIVGAAVAATQQVFAVALYRYAIDAPIGGFAPSDLEYPFTPRKEKRKSWILRIGGVILGFFVLLIIIGLIVGPRNRHRGRRLFPHRLHPEPSSRPQRRIPSHLQPPSGGYRRQRRNRRLGGQGRIPYLPQACGPSSNRRPRTSTTSGVAHILRIGGHPPRTPNPANYKHDSDALPH